MPNFTLAAFSVLKMKEASSLSLFDRCAFLELNANPARLDLDDVACAAARRANVPVVISTDAHSPDGLDTMRYGVMQARRGGLTDNDVANTRGWSAMRKLLGRA